MKFPTTTPDLAVLAAAQEALTRLAVEMNPTRAVSAALPSRVLPGTAPVRVLNAHRCHSYIKWPAQGLAPHTGGPWKVLDLCKAYNFPTGLSGGGVIGIIELEGGWKQSDLDRFSEINGLPTIRVEDVSVDGTNNNTVPNANADGEVALDIQVAAAAYYYATGKMPTIKVFWAKNDFRSFATVFKAATDAGCDVLSNSWGADEVRWASIPGSADAAEAAAEDATSKGCVLFAASGDNSSGDSDPGANVDLPAGLPHVIGCGGTTKTGFSEVVWGTPNSSGSGTGGGYSDHFPVQSWQIGAPPGPGRMVPDVAAEADPNTGYLIVLNGQEVQIGGTSAVAPLYSGLFAAFGRKLGFVTPRLYEHPECFTDITVGTNGGFDAAVGPDPCTGLGVPNGGALANLFAVGQQSRRNGKTPQRHLEAPVLERFRSPSGLAAHDGQAVSISSILSVIPHTFSFRENTNTPGRFLEQSVVVTVPQGAGFFVIPNSFTGGFTTADFQFLTERPLGQFSVGLGLRGNNFVCTVRLTDSNSDDPVSIDVSGLVVFFN